MRTLQEKYNGIQEGKFSKDHFIVEARMQHPNLITRFNGYDDAVQILKNRGMIQEGVGLSDYSDDALADMIINLSKYEGNEKEIQGVKDELAKRKENLKENYKEFTSQEKAKEDKAKQEKLGANKNLKIGDKVKVTAAAAKKVGLDADKEYTIRGFKEHGKGSLKSVDVLFAGNDSVNIDHVKKSIKEARLTKNSLTDYRYKPTNDMDKYPYEQILRGLRVELEGLGITATPTPDEYKKALAKVLKNLEKDEIFYTNQLAGVSKKVDLHDKMVDATAKNTVDTFNGMKKAELKEGIKNLLKNILAEDIEDYERASRAIELGVPEHPEEDAYQMQGPKSDQEFKSELDSYLEDNQIYGYTNKIHDIMTQEDPTQAAGDLALFLDRNQIYGYNRGIEAIYSKYPYQDMYENHKGSEEDEIDYDDENFSDPMIDGEDDMFESVSLKDLLN